MREKKPLSHGQGRLFRGKQVQRECESFQFERAQFPDCRVILCINKFPKANSFHGRNPCGASRARLPREFFLERYDAAEETIRNDRSSVLQCTLQVNDAFESDYIDRSETQQSASRRATLPSPSHKIQYLPKREAWLEGHK
ncbi:hypothetical protein HN011_002420 [Eciton burchellii]|nr:hypothetical protein HN011_002420 [Eciton burchellii]